jgi:transcriptional regulator with XRE-family HTH domain
MAFAKWKAGKRGRRKILIVRWRDIAAPGGWREERRPKDLTLTQAREYARDMERRADLVVKGFATEPGRTTLGEIWDRWWEKDGSRRRGDSKHAFRQALEKHLSGLKLELRWMREDLGLTQAELAKLAGVSQPAIAQLESPDSNPTIKTLNRVAQAMGAQIDFRPSAGESVKSYAKQLRRLAPGRERERVLAAMRDHFRGRTSRQFRALDAALRVRR